MNARPLGALLALFVACVPAAETPEPRAPPPRAPSPREEPVAWKREVIYLVLPDRFQNGDLGNDALGQPDCTDPTNPKLFHGGDLRGLRERIPYLRDLGVTAVWITPLYAQVPRKDGACGYHGYWADLGEPDDGAMEPKLGTPDDVSALVDDLHASGMKLIVDLVVNHAGRGARIAQARTPTRWATGRQRGRSWRSSPISAGARPRSAREATT
jgi:alpha-amylase